MIQSMLLIRMIIVTFLLLLCSPFPTFSQDSFPTIDAFLKATLRDVDRLSAEAKGDLNGDGTEDWVGVIHSQPVDATQTYQLFVLVRALDGSNRVVVKTQPAEIPGMGCCWMEDLAIRRGSIYVQNNAKTASTMEAATHQFKLHRGDWRLVGLRIYLTDHTPEAPKTIDTDMNVLTGLVIEKTQKGDNRPTSRRRNKRFPASFLKDFDFSNGFGIE
jgi:hypothetical protein